MKRFVSLIPLLLFALFIWGGSLLDVVTADLAFSELENRELTQLPTPTMDSLLSGQFVERYQTYVNDQFIGRPEWITLKSVGETALAKTENNNIVYGKEGFLFDKVVEINQQRLKSNLSYVVEFAEANPESQVYFSLVPGSAAVYESYLPRGLHLPDQLGMIQEVYGEIGQPGMPNNLMPVDVGSALMEAADNREQPLYYHTDHHWTLAGAATGYGAFVAASGGQPEPYGGVFADDSDQIGTIPGFYGTYYSKAKKTGTPPDEIAYLDPPDITVVVDGEEKPTLNNDAQFALRDKYAGLVWGNNGITVLSNKDYRLKSSPKTVVLIKDSYGNSLAPLFLKKYDQVILVDLRHTAGIQEILADPMPKDYYVVYSFANFTSDDKVIKLVPEG